MLNTHDRDGTVIATKHTCPLVMLKIPFLENDIVKTINSIKIISYKQYS